MYPATTTACHPNLSSSTETPGTNPTFTPNTMSDDEYDLPDPFADADINWSQLLGEPSAGSNPSSHAQNAPSITARSSSSDYFSGDDYMDAVFLAQVDAVEQQAAASASRDIGMSHSPCPLSQLINLIMGLHQFPGQTNLSASPRVYHPLTLSAYKLILYQCLQPIMCRVNTLISKSCASRLFLIQRFGAAFYPNTCSPDVPLLRWFRVPIFSLLSPIYHRSQVSPRGYMGAPPPLLVLFITAF